MKIKSLLAAVSMVAITAGSAHAISVTQGTNTNFQAPLALELDLVNNPVGGTVFVDIMPDSGNFNQGIQHTVVMTLAPGMVFSRAIQGSDLSANNGEQGNVFEGGADGSNTVTFQIAPTFFNTNTFTASLPVEVNSCLTEGSGITAVVSTSGGFVNNDADGDSTASGTAPGFGGCESAWNSVVAGTLFSGAGNDTQVALPGYNTIIGDSLVGRLTHTIDPAVFVNAAGTVNFAPGTDINGITTTIDLPGNPVPNGAVLTATNGTLSPTGPATSYTLTQTAAQAAGPAAQFRIAAGTAVLPTLAPVVSASTASFVTANGYIPSEPGATGDLEVVQRQGASFGAFDWNAGPAVGDPTFSVYRLTGLPANSTTAYTVTLTNSNANGSYSGAVTADAWGEAQLVSTNMMGVPAGVKRYDFSINLETAAQVDIDRILFRGDVVSDFGGGANQSATGTTPTTDFDNGGSE